MRKKSYLCNNKREIFDILTQKTGHSTEHMDKYNVLAEIVGYSADFDRMAKSQGIYELTQGFNQADTLNAFFLVNGKE